MGKHTIEKEIIHKFLILEIIKGKAQQNVSVGHQIDPKLKYTNFEKYAEQVAIATLNKRIDLVIENEKEVWIFEVKERLNPSALGQVLVYAELYKNGRDIGKKEIRKGILCKYIDELTKKVCDLYGVKVFGVA